MKTIRILAAPLLLLMLQPTFSQSKENRQTEKETKFEPNFLDLQAQTLTNLFGSDLNGKPDGNPLDFLELLAKSDLAEEQKKEMTDLYYIQSRNLTPSQKDSLSATLQKKMQKATITNNN